MSRAAPLAGLAGAVAATLQLAGALKTAPTLGRLPFDLTLAALAGLVLLLPLLLVSRRWEVAAPVGLPIAAAALLWLWLVVAGSWSPSRIVLAEKLPELVLMAPVMLAAGLLLGAEPAARQALAGTTLGIGVLVALGLLLGQGADGGLNYQLAGLAMAGAAMLAAVRAVESPGPILALPWLLLALGLALAAMLPGGRTALAVLLAGVLLIPALRLWMEGRSGAALAWMGAGLALLPLLLLILPALGAEFRTIGRLAELEIALGVRDQLWSAALARGGGALPFGLGTAAFSIVAGHGEQRGLYPHNHALEALAEGGLPALLLWLGAFGGGAVVALRCLAWVEPGRTMRILALVLPVAASAMVSSDLGNRMAWFALGLALSLGVEVEEVGDG